MGFSPLYKEVKLADTVADQIRVSSNGIFAGFDLSD